MGPFGVVVPLPSRQLGTGVGQRAKERLVQMFIAQPAVEAFDESILGWLAWCNVMPSDTAFFGPSEDRIRGKLGPVVRDDCSGTPPHRDDPVEFAGDPTPGNRGCQRAPKFPRLWALKIP